MLDKENHENSQTLFLVTQLGIESLAEQELNLKFPNVEQYKVLTGGILIEEISLQTCINLQHYMRTVTRLLLRIHETKVRDLPKLFNKCKKIEWNKYFLGSIPQINIKCISSRLFDDRKIEQTLRDAIQTYQSANAVKKSIIEKYSGGTPDIYLRLENDTATFSLDLTGERMDLRGDKVASSKASVRSTIAAAMTIATKTRLELIETIYNPMAGSGTLLSEHQNANKIINRSFSYKLSPLFEDLVYHSIINTTDHSKDYNYIASDLGDDSINALKRNIDDCEIRKEDFFEIQEVPQKTLLLLNPPYNKRIKYDTSAEKYVKRIIEKIDKLKTYACCIVHPHKFNHKSYKVKHVGPINNGGIKVFISLLIRNN